MRAKLRTFRRLDVAITAALGLGFVAFAGCGSDFQTPSAPLPASSSSQAGPGATSGGGEGSGNGGGGVGGSGGGATTTTGAGGSAGGCSEGDAPVLMQLGDPDKILLQGLIVLPGQMPNVLDGEVLIVGNKIQCVAASCAGDPQAAAASVVKTQGILLPGLIDAHNHVLFNVFDNDDWTPTIAYSDHNDWPNDLQDVVDAKQWLNHENYKTGMQSPIDVGCEVGKYAELKALIAGTTSVLGHHGLSAGDSCFTSLVRTLSDGADELGIADNMQVSTLTPPSSSSADGVCSNFLDGDTNTYVVHLGEGVIGSGAQGEWNKLQTIPTSGTNPPGCLVASNTTLIHANAFDAAQLGEIAAAGMSIVASVHVELSLYGLGTDTSVVTNIPLARSLGINVGIGPDWSLGGSINMLEELRWVEKVDAMAWGDVLTPEDVVEMATLGSAKALRLDSYVGSITTGKFADVVVIRGDLSDPYAAIIAATQDDVMLTIVNGVPLYGDPGLVSLGPASPGCETLEVCCGPKFLCVARAGGTTSDKLGQTLPEIVAAIEDGLNQSLPADGYQQFLPIAPLFDPTGCR